MSATTNKWTRLEAGKYEFNPQQIWPTRVVRHTPPMGFAPEWMVLQYRDRGFHLVAGHGYDRPRYEYGERSGFATLKEAKEWVEARDRVEVGHAVVRYIEESRVLSHPDIELPKSGGWDIEFEFDEVRYSMSEWQDGGLTLHESVGEEWESVDEVRSGSLEDATEMLDALTTTEAQS